MKTTSRSEAKEAQMDNDEIFIQSMISKLQFSGVGSFSNSAKLDKFAITRSLCRVGWVEKSKSVLIWAMCID